MSPLCVQACRVIAGQLPGRPLAVVQVEAAGLGSVAALEVKVVTAARQRAQKTLEAAGGRQALRPAETQVPLAHHVRAVTSLAQPLGQGGRFGGQAEGLAGADDGVLEPSVDLIPATPRRGRD